jgi:hypothetical protein
MSLQVSDSSIQNSFFILNLFYHFQLTFTPNWGGKRSLSQSNQNTIFDNTIGPQATTCNPKTETMVAIYRLIQSEAQKVLECGQQK